MKTTCFLITYEYPYQTSEPFLETEILSLSQKFEKIFIFSVCATSKEKPTRVYPSNVVPVPLGLRRMKAFEGILHGLFCKDYRLKIADYKPSHFFYSVYYRGRYLQIFHSIVQFLKKSKIDLSNSVFYSYWMTYLGIASYHLKEYAREKGYTNVCAISRAHAHDIYPYTNPLFFIPFQKETVHNLDGVFPCSQNGADYFQTNYPEDAEHVSVCRLGTIGPEHAQNGKRAMVFATCSNLYPLKRVDLFASAFALLAQKYDQAYWFCIGDGAEKGKISQIIQINHLESRVSFVGRLPNKMVLDFYASHDIDYFVNVSTREGLPVSIMEALSFGIPVIATDVGGTSELVSDCNGKLIDKSLTPATLFHFLDSMVQLTDTDYSLKRRAARSTWEEKVSAEKNYSEWCDRISK